MFVTTKVIIFFLKNYKSKGKIQFAIPINKTNRIHDGGLELDLGVLDQLEEHHHRRFGRQHLLQAEVSSPLLHVLGDLLYTALLDLGKYAFIWGGSVVRILYFFFLADQDLVSYGT